MPQARRYDIGDYWPPKATFTRGSVPTDPTTLTVVVEDPDGVETVLASAVDPTTLTTVSIPVARLSVGVYKVRPGVELTKPGRWFVRFEGTGLAAGTATHEAYCEPNPIDDEAPVMYMRPGELAEAIGLTDQELDSWKPDLVRACIAASQGIDELTGQRFWADADANQVRYYSADDEIVRTDPILELTSLDVDVAGDAGYATNLTVTDYVLEPRNAAADGIPYTRIRRVRRHGWDFDPWYRWSLAPNAVKVTAQFGWRRPPDAVVQATGILAARLLKRFREAPFGGATGIGLDGAGLREQQLDRDPELGFLLAPYRRTRLFV